MPLAGARARAHLFGALAAAPKANNALAVADLSAFATFLLFAGISAAGALAVYGAAPHGRRVILETLQMRRHLMRQEAQA